MRFQEGLLKESFDCSTGEGELHSVELTFVLRKGFVLAAGP